MPVKTGFATDVTDKTSKKSRGSTQGDKHGAAQRSLRSRRGAEIVVNSITDRSGSRPLCRQGR